MTEDADDTARHKGLNPKLKSGEDTRHNTETPTRPPADSTSVQREEGRAWPAIWLVVTVICVIVAIYLLFW